MASIFDSCNTLCCDEKEEDQNTPECVDCIANLTLPVPPGTQAGTRYIVTNTSGMVHPTWINLPAGLGENDIIEKDYQNLNWLLALDVSEEPCEGGGIIVYVDCRCYNYWYDECRGCWKEMSTCGFGGFDTTDELCADTTGQTQFTLSKIANNPHLSNFAVNGLKQIYGQTYTIAGTTLTWLGTAYELGPEDCLEITYC